MPLRFDITVDDQGNRAIKELTKNTGRLKGATAELGSTFQKVVGAYIGVQSVRAIANFANASVKAYMEQEAADKRLTAAMRERGVYSDVLFNSYKRQAGAM